MRRAIIERVIVVIFVLLAATALTHSRMTAELSGNSGMDLLGGLTNYSINNSTSNISGDLSTLPSNLSFVDLSNTTLANNTTLGLWTWGGRPEPVPSFAYTQNPARLSPKGIQAVIENRGG